MHVPVFVGDPHGGLQHHRLPPRRSQRPVWVLESLEAVGKGQDFGKSKLLSLHPHPQQYQFVVLPVVVEQPCQQHEPDERESVRREFVAVKSVSE
jgi:hypothetical protein